VLAFSDRDEDAELFEGHYDFLCDSIWGSDPPNTPPAAYRPLRNSSKGAIIKNKTIYWKNWSRQTTYGPSQPTLKRSER
jgi:hypothetical protein